MESNAVSISLQQIITILQWIADNQGIIGAGAFVIASVLGSVFKKNEVIARAMMAVERANKEYMREHGKDLPDVLRVELAYCKVKEYILDKTPGLFRPMMSFLIGLILPYEKVKAEIDKYIEERKKEAARITVLVR